MSESIFRVILTMEVQPGQEQAFEQAWLEVGKVVSSHPDNLAQWLSVDCNSTNQYVIISDWPDEATFRHFEKTPGHFELTGKLRALRTSGSMATMNVLHSLEGAGSR